MSHHAVDYWVVLVPYKQSKSINRLKLVLFFEYSS
jgi:hypothetical protein